MPAAVQDIAVGNPDGVHQQLVAHRASVDEPVLLIRLAARRCRKPNPTGNLDRAGVMFNRDGAHEEILAENLSQPSFLHALLRRLHIQQHALAAAKPETYIET